MARSADILVAAVGRPEMVKARLGQAGRNGDRRRHQPHARHRRRARARPARRRCRLSARASEVAGAITPVPGGVGPMTIAMLMANTVIAAHRCTQGKATADILSESANRAADKNHSDRLATGVKDDYSQEINIP